MKKALFLFITLISVINISAQENNVTIEQKVDSLQTQLNKLQHDYDYLECDYKLNQLKYDLSTFSSDTNISSNAILINYHHGRYDTDLYRAYKENYDARDKNLSSIEQNILATILFVLKKMETSSFTENEKNVLNSCMKSIESSLSSSKSALRYYKVVLELYKDLEW